MQTSREMTAIIESDSRASRRHRMRHISGVRSRVYSAPGEAIRASLARATCRPVSADQTSATHVSRAAPSPALTVPTGSSSARAAQTLTL